MDKDAPPSAGTWCLFKTQRLLAMQPGLHPAHTVYGKTRQAFMPGRLLFEEIIMIIIYMHFGCTDVYGSSPFTPSPGSGLDTGYQSSQQSPSFKKITVETPSKLR